MRDDGTILRVMSTGQQSIAAGCTPAAWRLRSGEVRRLRIARGGLRWLQVRQGELWLTRGGSPDDHWLLSGDAIALGSGDDVVVEAAADTCFDLLEAPQPLCATNRAWSLRLIVEWLRSAAATLPPPGNAAAATGVTG